MIPKTKFGFLYVELQSSYVPTGMPISLPESSLWIAGDWWEQVEPVKNFLWSEYENKCQKIDALLINKFGNYSYLDFSGHRVLEYVVPLTGSIQDRIYNAGYVHNTSYFHTGVSFASSLFTIPTHTSIYQTIPFLISSVTNDDIYYQELSVSGMVSLNETFFLPAFGRYCKFTSDIPLDLVESYNFPTYIDETDIPVVYTYYYSSYFNNGDQTNNYMVTEDNINYTSVPKTPSSIDTTSKSVRWKYLFDYNTLEFPVKYSSRISVTSKYCDPLSFIPPIPLMKQQASSIVDFWDWFWQEETGVQFITNPWRVSIRDDNFVQLNVAEIFFNTPYEFRYYLYPIYMKGLWREYGRRTNNKYRHVWVDAFCHPKLTVDPILGIQHLGWQYETDLWGFSDILYKTGNYLGISDFFNYTDGVSDTGEPDFHDTNNDIRPYHPAFGWKFAWASPGKSVTDYQAGTWSSACPQPKWLFEDGVCALDNPIMWKDEDLQGASVTLLNGVKRHIYYTTDYQELKFYYTFSVDDKFPFVLSGYYPYIMKDKSLYGQTNSTAVRFNNIASSFYNTRYGIEEPTFTNTRSVISGDYLISWDHTNNLLYSCKYAYPFFTSYNPVFYLNGDNSPTYPADCIGLKKSKDYVFYLSTAYNYYLSGFSNSSAYFCEWQGDLPQFYDWIDIDADVLNDTMEPKIYTSWSSNITHPWYYGGSLKVNWNNLNRDVLSDCYIWWTSFDQDGNIIMPSGTVKGIKKFWDFAYTSVSGGQWR
jgi:hypothetical protein